MNAEHELGLFKAALQRDEAKSWLTRWFHVDHKARALIDRMNLYGFNGPSHLLTFMSWIRPFKFNDYFESEEFRRLIQVSAERDAASLRSLGLVAPDADYLAHIGRYNAQDYLLQRFYPVPERQRVRRILDFGAGHGRMANLAFAEGSTIESMVVVDAIPASYLTQRLYYRSLDIQFADYIDYNGAPFNFTDLAEQHPLLHLPTWRMDLIPSGHFDMVCCVQVLQELPRRLAIFVMQEFARVLKPGGALYIRDHFQGHRSNDLEIDEFCAPMGFNLEFRARVFDRKEIHGIPRIWRKFDPELYLTDEDKRQ